MLPVPLSDQDSVSPSGSLAVSVVTTVPSAASSRTLAAKVEATTGASFTFCTATFTVAVSEAPCWSVTRTLIE